MTISERVDLVLRQQLGSAARWDLNTSLTTTLGFDAFDLVEFVLRLEKEFGIEIPDGDVLTDATAATSAELVWRPNMDRVADVVEYLTRRLQIDA